MKHKESLQKALAFYSNGTNYSISPEEGILDEPVISDCGSQAKRLIQDGILEELDRLEGCERVLSDLIKYIDHITTETYVVQKDEKRDETFYSERIVHRWLLTLREYERRARKVLREDS